MIAEQAVLADALSTAISVVGPDEGLRLLRHYGAEAYGVTKSGDIWASAGFPKQNLA